ncbi:serine hydrolase [Kutzneria buriramensis]|uniref:CubicO group peptidase (Beta-lactamase class C family) n=1 Tax=Kutzneria buriramensis TaxID=1045776 RepID=A0A3E0HZS6_9PSEU|nr:serine hydrolase domain-containing protein [Kutzneria buriramensis]REH51977.1 CubicO group peptidase (beta-lactamase class C family) [Kutzneria buriramensis]
MDSLSTIDTWSAEHAAVAVVDADGTVLGTYGPLDHRFALASVTKPLVAYAVLIAVEEGAVELDDPAGPPGATVRHLLAHTSGLAFDDRQTVAAPGTRRVYSSAGFEVLADTVQAATGIAFPQYLKEAVFEPLKMTSAELVGPAGSGAEASCADLIRFAVELQAPTLVAPETLAAATSVVFPNLDGVLPGFGNQRPNDWGLGFEIRSRKCPHWTGDRNSPATFGHFGAAGTFAWVDPAARVATIALTDRPFEQWATEVWPPFNDAVLAEVSALRGQ